MDKDVLSVIIPVYNAELYLEKCIFSIQKQSYQNMQIILIDDGSTDQSVDICKNLAQNDNRILFLQQPNSGPSAARNLGLSVAKGEFLTFVDADDCLLEKKAYEDLISIMKQYSVDAVFYGTRVVNNNEQYISIIEAGKNEVISADKAICAIMNDNLTYGGGFPWNKVWRYTNKGWAKFDRNLSVYEDKKWAVEQLLKSKDIYLSNKVFYCYYERSNSISHCQQQEKKRMLDGIIAYKSICDLLITKQGYVNFSKNQYLNIIFFTLWYSIRRKKKELFFVVFTEYRREIKIMFEKDYWYNLPFIKKLKLIIIWFYGILFNSDILSKNWEKK